MSWELESGDDSETVKWSQKEGMRFGLVAKDRDTRKMWKSSPGRTQ